MIVCHCAAASTTPHRPLRPPGRLRLLSCAAGPASPAPKPDAPAQAGAKTRLPLQVWVVDDDPVVALYLGELLHEHGFAVTTFADPQQALRAYEADPRCVDVVVTDQRMPELSGDLLARAMLKLRPQMRVILCTGYSDLIGRTACAGHRRAALLPQTVRRPGAAARGARRRQPLTQ